MRKLSDEGCENLQHDIKRYIVTSMAIRRGTKADTKSNQSIYRGKVRKCLLSWTVNTKLSLELYLTSGKYELEIAIEVVKQHL